MHSPIVDFRITAVENGWLFARIDTGTQQILLSNSHLGGAELPLALLRSLLALLDRTVKEDWLCWHAEACAYIWHMYRDGDLLTLRIFCADRSFGLPVRGFGLAQKTEKKTPILTAETDLFAFTLCILGALRESKGLFEQCEYYRDAFPAAECRALREQLRGQSFL